MKLRIGILGSPSPGWERLLEQEGVWYEYVKGDGDFDFSTVVAAKPFNAQNLSVLKSYLKQGGVVLCSGECYSLLTQKPSTRKRVQYLVPESGSPWTGMGMLDLDMECNIPHGARHLRADDGTHALFAGEFGGGYVIALPFDAGDVALDSRVRTKSFYAKRARLPFERVPSISKGALRKLVLRSLKLLHEHRGVPYVHKNYYPDSASSAFLFRIDTDYANEESIKRLHNVSAKHKVPATWFLDVKSQQGFLELFKGFGGNEIGIHCYEHETWPDEARNKENIAKANALLEKAGMAAKGFAAPYGKWNDRLAEALRSFDFEYSSEFSYDYDNLPSYPIMGGKAHSVLQVPIHPISVGGLKRQGFSTAEMIEYFDFVLAQKAAAGDPMFFYHHPNDGNEPVIEYIFEKMSELNIPAMTMLDYARWWKKRSAVHFSAEYSNGKIAVSSSDAPVDISLAVSNPKGKRAFLPVNGSFNDAGVEWKDGPPPLPLPADIGRTAQFNPWIPLIRTEDFLHRLF